MTLRAAERERRLLEGPSEDPKLRTATEKARGVVNDPELWCNDLDWLVNVADSQLGAHGTFSGFLSTMERGGPDGMSVTDIAPPGDEVLGTGARHVAGLAESAVERHRRVSPVFEALPRETRAVHMARYRTLRTPEWPGADGALGFLKGVVVLSHSELQVEKIMAACQKAAVPREVRGRLVVSPVIGRALTIATGLVRSAHRQYFALADLMQPERRRGRR